MTAHLEGPFLVQEPFYLVVDGRRIPHVQFFKAPNGMFSGCVDGRMSTEAVLTEAEVAKWGYLLANAMAVAAGYSHAGAATKGRPFAPQMMCLGSAGDAPLEPKSRLTLVSDGDSSKESE